MWRTPLAVCLLLAACKGAAPAAPDAAAQRAVDVEAQLFLGRDLRQWQPGDGGVVLVFDSDPRLKLQGASEPLGQRFTVKAGDTLTFVDRHFHHTFTLRSFGEEQLEFDYTWRHRPPSGEVETGAGSFTVRRGFDPAWRSCSDTKPCVVIPTYCSGYASVAADQKPLAESFYRKIGMVKSCPPPSPRAPPVATCVSGTCQPDPRF